MLAQSVKPAITKKNVLTLRQYKVYIHLTQYTRLPTQYETVTWRLEPLNTKIPRFIKSSVLNITF